ncbi:MAG: DUF3696 domain-containing protein [Nitrospirae bacterium]|nr:DUF3696 domain-containing protein [Nitrospirota bacterium]
MITSVSLKNFKCFKGETVIPTRKINLYTGINGRGKSTAIQPLLLMRQSIEKYAATRIIHFNGSCVELGSFRDVRNISVSQRESIEIGFTDPKLQLAIKYILRRVEEDDMIAEISEIHICDNTTQNSESDVIYELNKASEDYTPMNMNRFRNIKVLRLSNLTPYDATENIPSHFFFNKIHYISAHRMGPQDVYVKTSYSTFPNVGTRGEFTANILEKMKNEVVPKAMRLRTQVSETVLDQTNAWMNNIFTGGKIDITSLEANSMLMTFDTYKPNNTGFGYSYVLPIIVSGLIAKEGDILIVENPEAHLHPSAQSGIAYFLSVTAQRGVQVFIESHSENVLNGLRIAVKDKIIPPEDANIIYFDRDNDKVVKHEIHVDIDGKLDKWPRCFFDQNDIDLERICDLKS